MKSNSKFHGFWGLSANLVVFFLAYPDLRGTSHSNSSFSATIWTLSVERYIGQTFPYILCTYSGSLGPQASPGRIFMGGEYFSTDNNEYPPRTARISKINTLVSSSSRQLTGIREVGRSVHIYVTKKNLWPKSILGDVWPPYDRLYGQGTSGTTYPMLRSFNQLQIVAENDHFRCELSLWRKKWCFIKSYNFTTGNSVVNLMHFGEFLCF